MNVKRVNVADVIPGMLVAENIYNSINQLIVPRDARLTDKAITRLRFHSINSIKIFIEDPSSSTVSSEDQNTPSFFEKLRETEEYTEFHGVFANSVSNFENRFKAMLNDDEPDTASLVNNIKNLLSNCRTGIQVFDLLHCMRTFDDITYAHSINVSLICAVLGSWLDMRSEDIDILIQCGIFHDVGKMLIPKKILDKPKSLTEEEFEVMKGHTMRGYNLLRDKKLDKRVKLSAMMHHERCDGSGYPLGIKSEQIDNFAKIVSIADVYEAMTSPRIYRKPRSPFDALRDFEAEGLMLYDPKYLMTFMEHITQSYLGNRVRLSDGRIGTIIYINKLSYSKPMVQIGNDYIDLSKTSKLIIEAIL